MGLVVGFFNIIIIIVIIIMIVVDSRDGHSQDVGSD